MNCPINTIKNKTFTASISSTIASRLFRNNCVPNASIPALSPNSLSPTQCPHQAQPPQYALFYCPHLLPNRSSPSTYTLILSSNKHQHNTLFFRNQTNHAHTTAPPSPPQHPARSLKGKRPNIPAHALKVPPKHSFTHHQTQPKNKSPHRCFHHQTPPSQHLPPCRHTPRQHPPRPHPRPTRQNRVSPREPTYEL